MLWVGCDDNEIDEIRASQHGLPLPPEYEAFLRARGKGPRPDSYLRATGEDWYYPEILGFGELARQLFLEGAGTPLPEQYLVVSHYQGFQFMCVDPRSSTPLSVYRYMETHAAMEATDLDLADLLTAAVDSDDKGPPYKSEHVGGGIYRLIYPDHDSD